jgi:tetratricopeptide (TPR) repeat protein
MKSKNGIRRACVFLACGLVVAVFWYIEKTKKISQYGVVFYEMGLHCDDKCGGDRQLEYFRKAIRYNPEISDAYYRSALIYSAEGDYVRSLEFLRKAVESDQKNALAYYRMGLYYFNEGSYEYALRYFLQSYKIRGCPEEVHYYLGRIYDKKNEYDSAIPHYQSMVLAHKRYAAIIYPRLAEIYYFQNDEDAFRRRVNRLRDTNEEDLANQLERYYKAIQLSEIHGKKEEAK